MKKHLRAPIRVHRNSGFTLVELMFSIVIVAILLTVGVPALRDFIATQRVRSAADDFYTDLAYARSEAIKRNAQVSVVPASGSWLNGWSVQVGGNALRQQGAISNVNLGGDASATIIYNADGRTTLGNPVSFLFHLVEGSTEKVRGRCVTVSPSGKPAVLIDGNRDGNCANG